MPTICRQPDSFCFCWHRLVRISQRRVEVLNIVGRQTLSYYRYSCLSLQVNRTLLAQHQDRYGYGWRSPTAGLILRSHSSAGANMIFSRGPCQLPIYVCGPGARPTHIYRLLSTTLMVTMPTYRFSLLLEEEKTISNSYSFRPFKASYSFLDNRY